MIHTIKSSELSVSVNTKGMELCSIKSNISGLEYMWQADPSIWKGSSPVLFPIVGALKDGFTYIDGHKYLIPKHGLVRNSSKPKLIEATADSLRFSFTANEETLKSYPFNFRFELVFTLKGKTLMVEHHITNLDEKTMLYSVGGHPAFNCPLHTGEEYEEYFLEFSQIENDATYLVNQKGLIKNETEPILTNSKVIKLRKDLFEHDALIFKHLKSREVTLKHESKGAILSMKFDDFKYLGIWAKPAAPYVCLEPWLGIGDNENTDQIFENKEGIMRLASGKTDIKTYSISILN